MTMPFDIQLTAADRRKLLHSYRAAKNHPQRLRAHVLLLLDQGHSVAEAQAVAFADEAEVASACRSCCCRRVVRPLSRCSPIHGWHLAEKVSFVAGRH
jgi:hypothetical protein